MALQNEIQSMLVRLPLEKFYNSKRLHSYLGYVSPRQFEEEWLQVKAVAS